MGVRRHATYECDRCKRTETEEERKGRSDNRKYGSLAMFGCWQWRKIGFAPWPVFNMNPHIEKMLCPDCSDRFRDFILNKPANPTSSQDQGEKK